MEEDRVIDPASYTAATMCGGIRHEIGYECGIHGNRVWNA